MRHWWVNQNQTHRQERAGSYLWSPVRKANGARNPYYDYMREVGPGDLVFCFYGSRVAAVAIALSYCYDAPKPAEFGSAGAYWETWGHRITVAYLDCPRPFRPKDHVDYLRPFLPGTHSPLRPRTGDGLQIVYLTSIPAPLAGVLLQLAGLQEAELTLQRAELLGKQHEFSGAVITEQVEGLQVAELLDAPSLSKTEKETLILARRGQGQFRDAVLHLEPRCRVTHVADEVHLVASHIRPWRACQTPAQRLDGNNGLALAPHVDHLFDKGFISFTDSGTILTSPLLSGGVLGAFHIDASKQVGTFRDAQCQYLRYHREHRLLLAM